MSKKYIVNKVGGGIMVPRFLPLVKKQLNHQIRQGYTPVVVVSAVKNVTDTLISYLEILKTKKSKNEIEKFITELRAMHLKLFGSLSAQNIDSTFNSLTEDLGAYLKTPSVELEARIIAYGEKLSAVYSAAYFSNEKITATAVFAERIPLLTDNVIKDANILYNDSEKKFVGYIETMKSIPIIAGFTGRAKNGLTTLLGRGGTDTTACFAGAALSARKVVLWKDVGAVYSADPKLVSQAHTIPFLSYEEIEEAGKIIQGKAVRYLRQNKIPAEIASLINTKDKTVVIDGKKAKQGAKMISFKKNLTLFSLHQGEARGYERLLEISDLCARYKVNVILIWNDPAYLHVAAEDSSGLLNKLTEEVEKKFPEMVITGVHMITAVGSFGWKDVNKFNETLYTFDKQALMGACPYPQCMRMEGLVKNTHDVGKLLRVMHKNFIKK